MKPGRPPNKCNVPKHDHWTIHGIWPNKHRQKKPAFCRRDLTFRVSELDNIRDELEIKWLSVSDKNPEKFWKHEYLKHGTCAVVLNSMNTIEKYFRKGLELNYLYNIKYMLDKSNIIPGRRYSISQILTALNRELGVSPQVTCIRDKEKNQYIEEVRICFDKELRPISCKIHVTYETNCDTRKLVEYPSRFDDINER